MKNDDIIRNGFKIMSESDVAICSIVRNCGRTLKGNITRLEILKKNFRNFKVFVFENDSSDNTKEVLSNWTSKNSDVIVKCDNLNNTTTPPKDLNGINKNFSYERISRMAKYRNQYLEMLENSGYNYDFLIVIDLDIENFKLNGLAHSFGLSNEWDVITANGYSYSKKIQRRFHDTYALVEFGKQKTTQTEMQIFENQSKWSFLKPGLPLIPVYSAFGGLALYKSNVIRNKKYGVITNYDKRVEVKCEHFYLHNEIQQEGGNKIFINPNMEVFYERITFTKALTAISRLLSN